MVTLVLGDIVPTVHAESVVNHASQVHAIRFHNSLWAWLGIVGVSWRSGRGSYLLGTKVLILLNIMVNIIYIYIYIYIYIHVYIYVYIYIYIYK